MLRKLTTVGAAGAVMLATALGGSAAMASPAAKAHSGTELRVMSYNIHHGADNNDVLDLERIASEIEKSGAQVVGLQEVDNHWSDRSDLVDQAAWLADRLDMHYAYGANLDLEPQPGQTDPRQYGNAVLSEFPIIASENHLLTSIDYAEMPTEQRGLLETVINVRGNHISFYSTHLDHQRTEQRELAAEEIVDIAGEHKRPAIVVGDLNATPEKAELQPLFSAFTDTFAALGQNEDYTFAPDLEGLPGSGSVVNPTMRIDYILTRGAVQIEAAKVISTDASDHLPIVADLKIAKTPNGHTK